MWDLTVTTGSGSKSFGVTGWKMAWAYGSSKLIKNMSIIHDNFTNSEQTPIQLALAKCLEKELAHFGQPQSYFEKNIRELQIKRDFMKEILEDHRFKPLTPAGTPFILADWSALRRFVNLDREGHIYRDYKFVMWLTKNVKVNFLPLSGFFSEKHKYLGEKWLRICFWKSLELLRSANDKLSALKGLKSCMK